MILPAFANQPKQNFENALIKAKICLRQSRVIFASTAFSEFRLVCSSRRFFFGYFLFIAEKKVTGSLTKEKPILSQTGVWEREV